jgi:ATP-dependent DNA helicase 2 subunit 2
MLSASSDSAQLVDPTMDLFDVSDTDNELSAEAAYHNIMVLLPIQQYDIIVPNLTIRILMPQIRALKELLVVQRTNKGDGTHPVFTIGLTTSAMSALVVGLDLIVKYCRHLKYIKNIVMITDGRGSTDWSQRDEIAEEINGQSINLSIL